MQCQGELYQLGRGSEREESGVYGVWVGRSPYRLQRAVDANFVSQCLGTLCANFAVTQVQLREREVAK